MAYFVNNSFFFFLIGAIGLVIGVLMRFIPVKESENSFFDTHSLTYHGSGDDKATEDSEDDATKSHFMAI